MARYQPCNNNNINGILSQVCVLRDWRIEPVAPAHEWLILHYSWQDEWQFIQIPHSTFGTISHDFPAYVFLCILEWFRTREGLNVQLRLRHIMNTGCRPNVGVYYSKLYLIDIKQQNISTCKIGDDHMPGKFTQTQHWNYIINIKRLPYNIIYCNTDKKKVNVNIFYALPVQSKVGYELGVARL